MKGSFGWKRLLYNQVDEADGPAVEELGTGP
jgi:hypothetical protein